jgi:hypothetical protein
MGFCRKISLALFVVAVALAYQAYRDLSKPFERPELGERVEEFARNFQY